MRHALYVGCFDPSIAHILIALIPKVDVPTTFKDFRAISLCNVLYKFIIKVMIGRIRPLLQDLIGPLHSSFIPSSGTVDNAIILQVIVCPAHEQPAEPE